ncbi:hypothetical protein [Streptomyces sp. NPDC093589]|uniref:hypothetical protein n=1 Tax=Streptomyces sp. NPDC093589 TaxID=3366043 RepID=UPI00382F5CA4
MTTAPATEPTKPPIFGEWQPLPGVTPQANTPPAARRTGKLTALLATTAASIGLYAGAGGPLHLITLNQTGRHAALYTAAAAALVLLITVLANKTRDLARPTAGQVGVTVGALVCTGVGVNTAWMFTDTHLHITDEFTRVALCGTGEIVLVALGLAARDNLHRDQAPGTPGVLVWVITGFLAIPAYAEGSAQATGFWQALVAGTWRAAFGPVGAAILWHFAMGLEIKAIDAAARSKGFLARIGRRLGQKLLAAFGIADTDTTTTELLRQRARTRAANLSDRYASLGDWWKKSFYGRWILRRLRAALRTAGVSHDDTQKAALLADLAVSSHAPTLAQLNHESPWGLAAVVSETETSASETAVSDAAETETETSVSTAGETETNVSETTVSAKPNETSETTETETGHHETETTETVAASRKSRETVTAKVSAIGDRETETNKLLDLMRSRGGEMQVSLNDAIGETGRPKATAAKRLKAARDQYLAETA